MITYADDPAVEPKKETALSKRAMLAVLTIRTWSASKYDRKVSDEVAERHSASQNAGRYRKSLLPQESTSLEKVKKAATAAREWHYKNTLPWSQDGSRILPKDNYFNYVEAMRKFRQEFEAASAEFLQEYPQAVQLSKTLLGDLWRPEDYPNIAGIASKFSFDNLFLPFPDEKDFRVDIAEGEVKAIKRAIMKQQHAAVESAMRDCWNRLYEAVSHAVTKLSDPEAGFRDSLIRNLEDLCGILPRLNIAEDAHLEEMVEQVRQKLAGISPKKLRENLEARSTTAQDAAGILEMMKAYMPGQTKDEVSA